MTDFARDLKEMMAAWDKYRAIWIKKHGNDEGFAKWYQEQIAGLERKAKSSPPQFKDAGANDKQESNKDFMKRIGSRRNGYSAKTASISLSAICDRELARVGLADSKVPRPNIGDTFKRDGKTVTIRFVGQYDDNGGFWRVKIEGDNNWVNYPSRD
jgi:hypothetical protein